MERFESLEITPHGDRVVGYPDVSDRKALPELVAVYTKKTGNNCFIEVGSYAGATARLICDNNPDVTLYCVDTWKGSPSDATSLFVEELGTKAVFRVFCRNVKDMLYKRVFPCVGQSTTYAGLWPFHVAGVFIDAEHTFARCLEDMEAWWPHVADGGVLCGHDCLTFAEVVDAVGTFTDKYKLKQAQTYGNVWWIPKNDSAAI